MNQERKGPRPLILDAGALIALDRTSANLAVAILVQRARETGAAILVPVGALAQAWRSGSRQARLAKLLKSPGVTAVDLSVNRAKAAGVLCGRRGTRDVIDASVVVLARQVGGFIATSDPDDLRHLDPAIKLATIV